MYTALLAQKINKGSSGGEAELSGVPPLTFPADGTPLIDLLISGNEKHTGTPTPDNPIMPQGTGERTGNLFDGDYTVAVMSVSGNTATLNTTSSGRTAIVKCKSNTTYTVKKYSASNRFIIAESDIKPTNSTAMSIIQNDSSKSEYTFTTSNTTQYVTIYCSTSSEQAEPKLMLNTGSTPLPYEKFGYKIPILSANTATPIYLGEVETTRKVKKLVLTGNKETIDRADNCFRIPLPLSSDSIPNAVSTHLPYKAGWELRSGTTGICTSTTYYGTNYKYLLLRCDEIATTVSDFQTYLQQQYAAGTPVTIWYVLATPETAVVNEPLMKISTYADTLSKAQAGVAIPTNNGSTTLDVLTAVKPSNVSIKYRV